MTPYAWLLLLPAAAVAMWVVSRLIRSPRFAVALVPAAAGLANIRVPGVPGDVLVMHLLVAAALGCVLAHRFVYPRDGHPAPSVQRRTVTFLLALFFVVVMMSAAVGAKPLLGVTITTLLGVAFSLCVLEVVREAEDVQMMLVATVIGALGACAPALSQAGGVQSALGGTIVDGRPTGGFYDPNELGVFSAVSLMLALALVMVRTGRGTRWLAIAGVIVTVVALAFSFSRAAWMAAITGILVLLLSRQFRTRIAPVMFGIMGFTGIVVTLIGNSPYVDVLVSRLSSILSGEANPYDLRPQAWVEGLTLFWRYPILGAGPGSYADISKTTPSELWARTLEHPHNGLLTVLDEQGLAGAATVTAITLVVLAGLLRLIWTFRLSMSDRTSSLAYGLLAAMAVLGVHLSVNYALRNPVIMTTVWLVIGLAAALPLIMPTGSTLDVSEDVAPARLRLAPSQPRRLL